VSVFKEELSQALRAMKGGDSDAEYGLAPTLEAVEALERASVVVTSRGGIQIEWHLSGLDVEIEFDSEGRIESILTGRA